MASNVRLLLLFLVIMSTSSIAEVIDLSRTIPQSDIERFNNLAYSVQKQSGNRVIIISLPFDDQNVIDNLRNQYRVGLNMNDEDSWVMALINYNGLLIIDNSENMNSYFSSMMIKSLQDGVTTTLKKNGISSSIEFLLLNIADIISQHDGIPLGELVSSGVLKEQKKVSAVKYLNIIYSLLVLLLLSLFIKFLLNIKERKHTYYDYWGVLESNDRKSIFSKIFKEEN